MYGIALFIGHKFLKARRVDTEYCINKDGDLLRLGGRNVDICKYPFYFSDSKRKAASVMLCARVTSATIHWLARREVTAPLSPFVGFCMH